MPNTVRAIASANGKNKISILVPCHRVLKKNGELGGYGGGIFRKKIFDRVRKKLINKFPNKKYHDKILS